MKMNSKYSTEPGRLNTSRTKLTGILLVGIVFVVGSNVAVTGGANAVSTKHEVVLRGNKNMFSEASPAIEPKALVKITCDSSTNTYTATVKNVSVIDGYQNPFPTYAGQYGVLLFSPPGGGYSVLLTQNPKTALYDGSSSGTLVGLLGPECFSGATWYVTIENATYGTSGKMS